VNTAMSSSENDGPEQPPPAAKVGYYNPPMHRRFKKLKNSKGRPKGAKNRKTIVRMIANEVHTVNESGKRRRRSTLDLVLLRLRGMALTDENPRAFEEFHRLVKVYGVQESDGDLGYLVVPAAKSAEEWIAEEIATNPTRRDPRLPKPE